MTLRINATAPDFKAETTQDPNFDGVLRLLDSCQLTARQAKAKFPGGWKAPKPYLRIVPQPKD